MFRSLWMRIRSPHKFYKGEYQQFLAWLEESSAEWYFKNEKIRTDEDECPIVEVCNRRFGTIYTTDKTATYDAGRQLGLPIRLIEDIMDAADVPDRLLTKTRHCEIRRDLENITIWRQTSENVTGGNVQDSAGQPSSDDKNIWALSEAIQKIVSETTGIEDVFVYGNSSQIKLKIAPIEIFVEMSAHKIKDSDALIADLKSRLAAWKKEENFSQPINLTLIPMQWKVEVGI